MSRSKEIWDEVDVWFNSRGRYLGYFGRHNWKGKCVRMKFENFQEFLAIPKEARFYGRALLFGEKVDVE